MANNDLHGGAAAGPSSAGPSRARPSTAGPSTAGPSRARPSTAGPSTAGPSRARPSTAGPSTAGPSRARPSAAGPSRARPSAAGPSRARPSAAAPPIAPGLPLNFANLPEGRVKFQHRRNEFARLRQEFKNSGKCRPDMKAMKQMNDMQISYRFQGSGSTPGVEVGDTFDYRSEMVVVGLHRAPVSGICYVSARGGDVATSIVASGGYEDNDDQGEKLIYSGQGGNDYRGSKQQVENQSQTRGNAAMTRSKELQLPVRVIRGLNVKVGKVWIKTYTYDGLYKVKRARRPTGGKSGHQVYKFELRRCPGQPNINITRVRFGGDAAH